MAFLPEKEKQENLPFVHFSKKEMDWLYRPKESEVGEFIKKDFDLLLNLSTSTVVPLQYIAALSEATYRVGPASDRTDCYELMIDSSSKTTLTDFIKQMTFFLNKMQSSVAEPVAV